MCVLYTVLGLRRHVLHVNFSLMFGKGKRFELEAEWNLIDILEKIFMFHERSWNIFWIYVLHERSCDVF